MINTPLHILFFTSALLSSSNGRTFERWNRVICEILKGSKGDSDMHTLPFINIRTAVEFSAMVEITQMLHNTAATSHT